MLNSLPAYEWKKNDSLERCTLNNEYNIEDRVGNTYAAVIYCSMSKCISFQWLQKFSRKQEKHENYIFIIRYM